MTDDAKALIKRARALTTLCDPECEGRCRVCPQGVVNELIKSYLASEAAREKAEAKLKEAERQRDHWQEEARNYASNADHHREYREKAEAEVTRRDKIVGIASLIAACNDGDVWSDDHGWIRPILPDLINALETALETFDNTDNVKNSCKEDGRVCDLALDVRRIALQLLKINPDNKIAAEALEFGKGIRCAWSILHGTGAAGGEG